MNRRIVALLWWLMVVHASGAVTGPVMKFKTQMECRAAWTDLFEGMLVGPNRDKTAHDATPDEVKSSVCIEHEAARGTLTNPK
jgi:hypothetical protein